MANLDNYGDADICLEIKECTERRKELVLELYNRYGWQGAVDTMMREGINKFAAWGLLRGAGCVNENAEPVKPRAEKSPKDRFAEQFARMWKEDKAFVQRLVEAHYGR